MMLKIYLFLLFSTSMSNSLLIKSVFATSLEEELKFSDQFVISDKKFTKNPGMFSILKSFQSIKKELLASFDWEHISKAIDEELCQFDNKSLFSAFSENEPPTKSNKSLVEEFKNKPLTLEEKIDTIEQYDLIRYTGVSKAITSLKNILDTLGPIYHLFKTPDNQPLNVLFYPITFERQPLKIKKMLLFLENQIYLLYFYISIYEKDVNFKNVINKFNPKSILKINQCDTNDTLMIASLLCIQEKENEISEYENHLNKNKEILNNFKKQVKKYLLKYL